LAQTDLSYAEREEANARAIHKTGIELDSIIAKTAKARAERNKAQGVADIAQKAVVATDPIVPALSEAYGDWKTLFGDFSGDLTSFGIDLANTMTSTTAVILEANKIATGL